MVSFIGVWTLLFIYYSNLYFTSKIHGKLTKIEMACVAAKDRLVSGLCRQRESGEYCDVMITISDVNLTAHSNVLAISSMYFSDIARKSSSLLPHIPSTRVGGHVILSVTIEPGGRNSMDIDQVLQGNSMDQDGTALDDTQASATAISQEVMFMHSGNEAVSLDQVVFSVQDSPNLMAVLRGDLCNRKIHSTMLGSGDAGEDISNVQSSINNTQNVTVLQPEDDTVEDVLIVDASDMFTSSEKVMFSDTSPSGEIASVGGRASGTSSARAPRGARHSYRYRLELSPAEGAAAELELLADCARRLLEFAYCGPLTVSEETYPVLHDMAKLLQMEEAVSLCEKHAVDRLVGTSEDPPPPPPPGAEQKPESRRRTQGGDATSQLHVCRRCSFTCHGAARIRQHRRMHHVRSYVCGFCGVTRQKTSQLLRHLIEAEHGETVCSLCFHECGPGESMAEHYRRHNDPRPFFCSVCFARFPSRTGLNLHMPTHSSAKPFECGTCGRAFKWRHALQSHARTHGAEKQLLCDVCGFCTRHTGQFKAHKARHAGATEPCPHEGCSFRASTGWLLKDHLVTHAADKQYQCEVCGKKFGHARNMRRHALLHRREGAIGCHCCPYQTTRSDKLAQHVRVKHAQSAPSTSAGTEDPPPPPLPPPPPDVTILSTPATSTKQPRPGAETAAAPAAKRRRKTSPAASDGSQPVAAPAPRAGRGPVPILPRDPQLVPRPAEGPPRRVRRRPTKVRAAVGGSVVAGRRTPGDGTMPTGNSQTPATSDSQTPRPMTPKRPRPMTPKRPRPETHETPADAA